MSNQSNEIQKTENNDSFIKKTASDTISKTISTLLAGGILGLISALIIFLYGLPIWLYLPIGSAVFCFITLGLFLYGKFQDRKQQSQSNAEIEAETPLLLDSSEIKKEKVGKERSNISVALVIDSVDGNKVDFHLELENKGNVAVKITKTKFNANSWNIADNKTEITRTLPPGNKLSIPTFPGIIKPFETNRLIVQIIYSVEINGEEKEFTQTVPFSIRPSDFRPQTIYPEAREEKEGGITQDDVWASISQMFIKDEATISFVVSALDQAGKPEIKIMSNMYRSFVLDALVEIVTFKMKIASGQIISLDMPLKKSKKGVHAIILSWNYLKGGSLWLDGVEKEKWEKIQDEPN